MLTGFIDADWVSDPNEWKATTGYAFTLGSGVISWASQQQPSVALSETEAEYKAVVGATYEAVWLRQILSDLSFLEYNLQFYIVTIKVLSR